MARSAELNESEARRERIALVVTLTPEQEEALVTLVAERLRDDQDDGFLDVRGAAEYLSTTPKGIYAAVARQKLPHDRQGGRLLFDRRELRDWVKGGG
jgi:excisionase family DNA binding protein